MDVVVVLTVRDNPEAFDVLLEGAARQPDQFVDELLFHFPDKVPAEVIAWATGAAGIGRLILLADVHAEQGRPDQALETFRTALGMPGDWSARAILRLAVRPVFSLHAHARSGQLALR
jgi:hypothetical protein